MAEANTEEVEPRAGAGIQVVVDSSAVVWEEAVTELGVEAVGRPQGGEEEYPREAEEERQVEVEEARQVAISGLRVGLGDLVVRGAAAAKEVALEKVVAKVGEEVGRGRSIRADRTQSHRTARCALDRVLESSWPSQPRTQSRTRASRPTLQRDCVAAPSATPRLWGRP